MPELTTIKSVVEMGLGTSSFVILIYAGYKAAKWGERVAENHLTHIESGMASLVELTKAANAKLDALIEHLTK